MKARVLTGITTTGTPHLGNYVGAIRPAIAASREPGIQSFFFLADYHALVKCDEPDRVERSRLELAATWLACGLDPQRVAFYRQSDIPETPELTWLLTCVTAKGQMNRAHAYKAALDANLTTGEDADAGISMGLYSYPILMAADILLFNAHRVPVGKDQVQHIEMARDVAQRFNHLYGHGHDLFVLPQAEVEAEVELLPGLDGRKMSKSYDNIVPLFEGGAKGLREAIARIVTDSKLPGEPKEPAGTALVAIFDAFSNADERAAFRAGLRAGLAWGEAKQQLVEQIDRHVGPMRAHYEDLMAHPERIEDILQSGAQKARAVAKPFLESLRRAVGLRPMLAVPVGQSYRQWPKTTLPPPEAEEARRGSDHGVLHVHRAGAHRAALASFKQYRESDGRFHFKLVAADGTLLLQSDGFADGREAGGWVKRLNTEGASVLDGAPVRVAEGVDNSTVQAALAALVAARS